jgi:hypothetical protein
MLINETPIRTSKSFNINNIEINDFNINKKDIKPFQNYKIENNFEEALEVNNIKNDIDFKYGLGQEIENYIKESNLNLEINLNDYKNKENILKIDINLDDQNMNLISNIVFNLNEGSKNTITFILKTNNKTKVYNAINKIKVNAMENSNTNFIFINNTNTKTYNFLELESEHRENSKLNFMVIDFGGKYSVTNLYSNVKEYNAEEKINGIYLGKDDQVLDLNYIAHLYGKNTKSFINIQGALLDKSIKHFKGTIDFKNGCKKAEGDVNEECMLLSDKAKSTSFPALLATEDDVNGSHSNAISKVDNKSKFYVMSRGFSKKETEILMIKAKFNKILENIEDIDLRNNILEEIENRLIK